MMKKIVNTLSNTNSKKVWVMKSEIIQKKETK